PIDILNIKLFVIGTDDEAPAIENGKGLANPDQSAREFAQRLAWRANREPIEPSRLIILRVGVIVATLGVTELVAGKEHRRPMREQHGCQQIALLPFPQRDNFRILRRTFSTVIP